MDALACDGTEHDISDCKFRGWGSSSCNHRKDVVVQCQTRVRLVDGPTPSRGRVEVMYRGEWGTICDDSFGQEEAAVVCRMLGYHNSSPTVYSQAHFGQRSGPIWLDAVRCSGKESDLGSCSYKGWGKHDCSHSEDAGVDCGNMI
ncbi:scavenger receptor cysteine-rich type 1 protein M130-like [Mytilus californianus]|uniref:scavenger receptor cysteine-rich type 1 protein M130-like n=1 Tax=Mytilus californianus TaxID=6549 RepID=UPI002246CFAF|nr:scavenger receptor cysteine-rich type 1 protein M130-like [Mytilus californianus]